MNRTDWFWYYWSIGKIVFLTKCQKCLIDFAKYMWPEECAKLEQL